MNLIPYVIAIGLLTFSLYLFVKTKRPKLGIVVSGLPILNISIDVFYTGNLTVFREIFSIFYGLLLISVVFYNLNRKKL